MVTSFMRIRQLLELSEGIRRVLPPNSLIVRK